MNRKEIKDNVLRVIRQVADVQALQLPELDDDHEIVDDLGFTSLSVASIIANLEDVLGADPFQDETVMITDIRTIKDLCDAYAQCLPEAMTP